MRSRFSIFVLLGAALLLPPASHAAALPSTSAPSASAAVRPNDLAEPAIASGFEQAAADVALRWAADDAAIAAGETDRSWTWGPQIFRSEMEPYREGPQSRRAVWYLDKARMEVTHPERDSDDAWYVSSGLLVREMIAGRVQTGDTSYESREAADVPIAGDIDAALEQTVTYADLQPLASLDNDRRVPSRLEFDPQIVELLGKSGAVTQDERLLQYDIRLGAYDEVLGHNIARVFTDAIPADQLLYTAGRPLSEPYWVTVPISHTPTDVLVQAFERRVLTYTPTNPEGWNVEWGNVGRQYAQWRYGWADTGAPYDPAQALEAKPTIQKLEVLSPAAARIALERKGIVGVAVLNMRTGNIYSISGPRDFPMYSTAKLPIMLGVLNKVQREKRAVASWEDSLIRDMIQQSDNEAATALIVHAGGAAALNRYLRAIGIANTTMDGDSWGFSTTTPQDMVRLMAKLGNCTILNAKLCHYALEIMRHVTPSQAWGVSAGPPATVSVALKNGWLPESEGWAINSVGYVKGKQLRYAIAVYTRPNPSKQYGIDTAEAIAAEVWKAMQ